MTDVERREVEPITGRFECCKQTMSHLPHRKLNELTPAQENSD